jgi:nucleotide-binding universal stress UspA family protein
MYNYILVPLDGSNRAEAILPHVEELGKRYDAQVIFLRVVEPMPISVGPGEASMLVPQEEIDRLTEQAVAYLAILQEQFRAKDIEARTCVYYGPVVQAIIDAAECECADLIAMASHGRSGTSQVFYGSVAVGVLHRADRPLLLVRSRDSE